MHEDEHRQSQWAWLEHPDSTFELHSTERRAFYAWQVADKEWSKATCGLDAKGRKQKQSKKNRKALKALEKRLNMAAKAYEMARSRLHDAWSA
ncbi:MAG: hypothetical protein JMN27_11470 [gamma proteobacterium endosymbiont of Lamellibrachia anaximandri]|nr:hypothetical protein [gamma proteobacterium endosymbiont of Lamellibrachia anaximandri]MBL3534444.1 hypothetical protein [gamma proteobacterium endosymbiont of Lamellibrachia anaximandri]MBL3600066.1 hypothetical protein [gamma proteobacterium endosymbiont of Lamellibrachia anaximandri]